ncbi:MAG: HAMP domain-containing histidine kinase [Alphaproteobacteria bacterium]|nr:HAMP domain-containing histidine kinase [Alphaproteobacteria bacterium]
MTHDGLVAIAAVRASGTPAETARRTCEQACAVAGFRVALLTIATPAGTLVTGHGLSDEDLAWFASRPVTLAERTANRARLRARAFPDTGIAWIPAASSQLRVRDTVGAERSPGGFGPDDALYVMVPGIEGEDIGVLSLDAPLDGRAPDPANLDALLEVELLLARVGPLIEARMLRARLEEREAVLVRAQRSELVGQLAIEVAHDLNNLMTVVVAESSMAEVRDDLPPGLRRVFTDLMVVGDRAGELCSRLLRVGRPTGPAGGCDPMVVVAEQHELLDRLLADAGVRLRFELQDAPRVALASGRLAQVLLNLVVNARDVGAREVVVSVGSLAVHGVTYAQITVRDDGPGMSDEVRARVFEPWFTTREGGTGIGLATVRRIVERAGGQVTADAVTVGASFTVTLPAAT